MDMFMPVWQLKELEGARHLFPGVSKHRLHELFSKWGGSVRWCLANALGPTNEDKLTEGINCTNLPALQAAVSNQATINKVPCLTSRAPVKIAL